MNASPDRGAEKSVVIAVTDGLSKSGPTLDKLAKPVAWRIFKNVHWWVAMPVVILAFFGVTYVSIRAEVVRIIAKQFEEPHIRAIVEDVASKQAKELILTQVNPEVERFKNEVNERIGNFQDFMDNLKSDFQKDNQILSQQVSQLRQRNYLTILGDRAISDGDREAFDEINTLSENGIEYYIRVAAGEEFRRVLSYYLTLSYTEYASIILTRPDGTKHKNQELSTMLLTTIVRSSPDWKNRAISARLLRTRREKGVPDVLLEVARVDKHVEVVKYAIESFTSITGSDVRGLFQVDLLDKWWKEHSQEVNEKLTDMKPPTEPK